MIRRTDVFRQGVGRHHTYRIPALLTSRSGRLLAFCEGRDDSADDHGQIELLVRRSDDLGATWSETESLSSVVGYTSGNPAPVQDRGSGRIHLLFCRNRASDTEQMIIQGRGGARRTIWRTHSDDDGVTWSDPLEISPMIRDPPDGPDWAWFATGPGHGIQLRSGLLCIPANYIIRAPPGGQNNYSMVLLSADGAHWRPGGIAPEGGNESSVVELDGGDLYLSMRNRMPKGYRAYSISTDGGLSFGPLLWDPSLPEPICQGSIIRHSWPDAQSYGRVLFSNPAHAEVRCNLTVRSSRDETATWDAGRALEAGPSFYSDLTVFPDGTIGCLYERGSSDLVESITLARFDLEWLDSGAV